MDSQLESFLNRFGDPEDVARGSKPKVKTMESLTTKGLEKTGHEAAIKPGGLAGAKDLKEVGGSSFDAAAVGGAALDAAPAAMGLLGSVTGKGFDTSAEGGGVGNGRGAILEGASQGAQLGKVAGPWGMAIGAAVGAGGTALAHGKAQREYMDNRQDMHKSKDAVAKAESRNRYAVESDEESMQIMKGLYQKQLGIA